MWEPGAHGSSLERTTTLHSRVTVALSILYVPHRVFLELPAGRTKNVERALGPGELS